MKSTNIKLLIWLLSFLVVGCSLMTDLTKGEIGQPISTVIQRNGAPTRVVSDGSGGSIYLWEQSFDRNYGMREFWSTSYWVDSKGIIYKWE